ncbi:hypothetical protein WJS89_06070 [Sphingomicrobium sp. XHP0235]|uniref:hypothetical protein n=1 Tax=Sphingomicrobium aquimarinum TaxID=3133971 RepID=UPI0031FEF4CB
MTITSSLVMLFVGAIALVSGVWLLTRRPADEPARYRNRIAGTMATALGLALTIFALGLGANPFAPTTQGETR